MSINCSSLHYEMATLLKLGSHWSRSGFLPVGILSFYWRAKTVFRCWRAYHTFVLDIVFLPPGTYLMSWAT